MKTDPDSGIRKRLRTWKELHGRPNFDHELENVFPILRNAEVGRHGLLSTRKPLGTDELEDTTYLDGMRNSFTDDDLEGPTIDPANYLDLGDLLVFGWVTLNLSSADRH